jgi:hypothetical protein
MLVSVAEDTEWSRSVFVEAQRLGRMRTSRWLQVLTDQ